MVLIFVQKMTSCLAKTTTASLGVGLQHTTDIKKLSFFLSLSLSLSLYRIMMQYNSSQ